MRVLASLVGSVIFLGCGAHPDEGQSADSDLRSNPSAQVSTNDPNVRVLGGFTAFLDQATSAACIIAPGAPFVDIGNVTGSFYLRQVKTRADLAKELDVDVSASVKAPEGSIDGSVKLVNSFKSSSTTVTFLVRSLRSYTATNRSDAQLSPLALDVLGRGAMGEFLQKCGASWAKSIRYEAQVVALLEFEAKTEESARSIATSFGGATPSILKTVASASADLKSKAEATASANDATLSLSISATGFVTNGRKVSQDIADHSFEKVDELNADLEASFNADVAADRAGYATNSARNARAALVGQASYSSLGNAPTADYASLGKMIQKGEEFVGAISPIYLRLNHAYTDEVAAFLADTNNQFRYNLASAPQVTTASLVPIAQTWESRFGADGGDSLVAPLREAIDDCTSAAANGSYDECVTSPSLEEAKAAATSALATYGREGRILPVIAWMPTTGATMSFGYAEGACEKIDMRLPTRAEAPFIAPAVSALAQPYGEVWIAADASCPKPVYANAHGESAFRCGDSAGEALPYVGDRPVVCVSRSGPMAAVAAP